MQFSIVTVLALAAAGVNALPHGSSSPVDSVTSLVAPLTNVAGAGNQGSGATGTVAPQDKQDTTSGNPCTQNNSANTSGTVVCCGSTGAVSNTNTDSTSHSTTTKSLQYDVSDIQQIYSFMSAIYGGVPVLGGGGLRRRGDQPKNQVDSTQTVGECNSAQTCTNQQTQFCLANDALNPNVLVQPITFKQGPTDNTGLGGAQAGSTDDSGNSTPPPPPPPRA